jgi:S1-C subfamily serine protease
VQRGWLGIQVRSLDGDLAKEENLSLNEGAYVLGFGEMEDKSAAKEAGVQKGDIIVMLDKTAIKTSSGLIEYIGRKRPGDKVNVTVNREGLEKSFVVTLKNRDGKFGTMKREEKDIVATLGMELEDGDTKLLKRLDLSNGVKVKALGPGKIERYTEMRDGFIITRVDDKTVKSAKEVNDIIKGKKPGELITFSGVYEDFPREYNYAIRM